MTLFEIQDHVESQQARLERAQAVLSRSVESCEVIPSNSELWKVGSYLQRMENTVLMLYIVQEQMHETIQQLGRAVTMIQARRREVEIPEHVAEQIQAIADKSNMTLDEAASMIIKTGLESEEKRDGCCV